MSERNEPPQASQIILDCEDARERARRVVIAGGIIAFRTDSFYGLGADPFNREAVARINRLKEREGRKPVLVVICTREEADRFIAEKTALFDKLTEHFWPGLLTVVGRARSIVPFEITAGSESVGLRLPLDEDVRAFVRACGGALTATSANLAGQPPARTAMEVADYFPNQLDLIVDGGPSRTDKPSTVVDVSTERARLIREGEIPRARVVRTLKMIGAELE